MSVRFFFTMIPRFCKFIQQVQVEKFRKVRIGRYRLHSSFVQLGKVRRVSQLRRFAVLEYQKDITCFLLLFKWGMFEGFEFYEELHAELEFYTLLQWFCIFTRTDVSGEGSKG